MWSIGAIHGTAIFCIVPILAQCITSIQAIECTSNRNRGICAIITKIGLKEIPHKPFSCYSSLTESRGPYTSPYSVLCLSTKKTAFSVQGVCKRFDEFKELDSPSLSSTGKIQCYTLLLQKALTSCLSGAGLDLQVAKQPVVQRPANIREYIFGSAVQLDATQCCRREPASAPALPKYSYLFEKREWWMYSWSLVIIDSSIASLALLMFFKPIL